MTKFIITQHETDTIQHLGDFDVLISENDESICLFDTYEEAVEFLMEEGVRYVNGRFLNNVNIERLQ